jgi:hypothetical protein
MGFLIGSGPKVNSRAAPRVTGLRVQTSANGMAIPLVYGQTRIAGNLIWYGDFQQIAHHTGGGGGGGGKGGAAGGGGKGGSGGGVSYTYQTALALGLCEGPVAAVFNVWSGKSRSAPEQLNLTVFPGAAGQSPWGYLTTQHSGQDLAYRGLAYLAAAPFDLGTSQQLPNLNAEIQGAIANAVPGLPDADPASVLADLLTNASYGLGFPAARLGSLATYSAYCRAAGLVISPAFVEQRAAADYLKDLLEATNGEAVWSAGALTVVPYGDAPLAGNGASYAPPAAPIYSLGDDDFLADGNGGDPVQLSRARPADQVNALKAEYLDRGLDYNASIAEAKDDAAIQSFGLRAGSTKQTHFFCLAGAARLSAQLMLQRQQVRNQYVFHLGWKHILLDPMDIVAITDAALGLEAQWVRIREIEEDEEGRLKVTAEEYLAGTGSAPLFGSQPSQGYAADYNADPGIVNAPVIFEPAGQLAQDLEIWAAVSGGDPLWAGCDVWASSDGSTYARQGRIEGGARTGTLTASLPAGSDPDASDLLAVDLSECAGALLSGTRQDADNYRTLCYVDGELLAYQSAALTGASRYQLSYLRRGAYGTADAAHAEGARFARLDGAVFKLPYDQSQIGSTVFLKFVSFNAFGAYGPQSLAGAQAYPYTITGSGLRAPLPDVASFTSTYVAGLLQLTWSEVSDFRSPIDYEIRIGPSWAAANFVRRVAHPPFPVQGDGTYWLAAHYRAPQGVEVYSAAPAEVVVAGSVLTKNVVASSSEAATRWSGTVSGGAALLEPQNAILLAGTGDVLALADFLGAPDLLWLGGVAPSGAYALPAGHAVAITRPTPCTVGVSYSAAAQSIRDNFLTIPDLLGDGDLFGAAYGSKIAVTPQIALAQADGVFGPWMDYVPGQYTAQHFKCQVLLASSDPTVTALLEEVSFLVDVPDRLDPYVGLAVPAGGLALAYQPPGAAAPVPFNGGPGGAATPNVQVTIASAQAGDDVLLTAQSLAGCTIQVVNGGSGVARDVNVFVQGY